MTAIGSTAPWCYNYVVFDQIYGRRWFNWRESAVAWTKAIGLKGTDIIERSPDVTRFYETGDGPILAQIEAEAATHPILAGCPQDLLPAITELLVRDVVQALRIKRVPGAPPIPDC